MRPADQTEYIVQCIREAGSMYEDDARQFLARHDTHVRAEAAADVHRAELPTFPAGETPENVAKVVRAVDVRLAERGAEAPYGVEKGTEAAAPDFFQPGHTYSAANGTAWMFRVDVVTTHPEDGERTALGWRHFDGTWEPYAYGEDDWDIHQRVGHSDITEEVAR
ncbi:hypothetical protein RFN58_07170 [Streptomyces iakyrus]|uniref:hypothetical protein n=1 Tax=Streptomyces iakyrus TaxID=68219 RepID=UPI0005271D37|nr:hypothetical protein [Streptomyces iakyrus]